MKHTTFDTNEYIDAALLVLAGLLVEGHGQEGHSALWSYSPFKLLLPKLFVLLNYHPERLGDAVERLYAHPSVPVPKNISALLKNGHSYSKTVQDNTDYSGSTVLQGGRIPATLLMDIANKIVETFVVLRPEQEQEHHFLEGLVDTLYPFFTLHEDTVDIGFEVMEYADFWQPMTAGERAKLRDKLMQEGLDRRLGPVHITNRSIFNAELMAMLLDPFAPGMSQHITPIKYEALTPDLFALLFQTTGKDGKQHYFVLLEYDYVKDLDEARAAIEQWHGQLLEFMVPAEGSAIGEGSPLSQHSAGYGSVYRGVLARVKRPVGRGYWAEHIVVRAGDDLEAALAHLPEEQRRSVIESIKKLNAPDGAIITVHEGPDGRRELFYG